jgi:hypothetical protein
VETRVSNLKAIQRCEVTRGLCPLVTTGAGNVGDASGEHCCFSLKLLREELVDTVELLEEVDEIERLAFLLSRMVGSG